MADGQSSRLRAAIVGPGYIGAVHAESLRRVGGDVSWIVGRPGSDLAARAAVLGVPRFTSRLEDALEDASVDVVHVCTPNALHYPVARAALAHGKHLVCEKPLTTSAAHAADLVRQAQDAGVVAGVAYCYRYYPLVQQARHLVSAGTLGSVHHVRGLYLADELLHHDYLHYRFDRSLAGPSLAMADVGVHWCDLAEHVAGQRIVELLADVQTTVPVRTWRRGAPGAGPVPGSASADAASHDVEIAGEDCLSLLLRFDGGAHGAVTVSQVSPGFKNWIVLSIDGSQAGVDWNQEQPNSLTVRRRAPAWELLPKDPTLMASEAAALAHAPGGHPEGYLDAFRNLIAAIYDAIQHAHRGETPGDGYPTLEDGYRGVLFVEAALQSARERRWVAVGSS
jgi:predicted dehydrogenase